MVVRGLDLCGSIGKHSGCLEHGNEPSCSKSTGILFSR